MEMAGYERSLLKNIRRKQVQIVGIYTVMGYKSIYWVERGRQHTKYTDDFNK